jgi:hypothetical protein
MFYCDKLLSLKVTFPLSLDSRTTYKITPLTMPISTDDMQSIGEDESRRWQETYKAVVQEVHQTRSDFDQDRKLARELHLQNRGPQVRDERKQALASDEAVAHGLTRLRKRTKSEGRGISFWNTRISLAS